MRLFIKNINYYPTEQGNLKYQEVNHKGYTLVLGLLLLLYMTYMCARSQFSPQRQQKCLAGGKECIVGKQLTVLPRRS